MCDFQENVERAPNLILMGFGLHTLRDSKGSEIGQKLYKRQLDKILQVSNLFLTFICK